MNALPLATVAPHALEKPLHHRTMPVSQGGFILLFLCWLVLMLWPCLTQETLFISRADNAVMTLMAAVILAAVRTAILARDRWHALLFTVAELLYCGAY